MATDPVRDYLSADRSLEQARGRVEGIVARVRSVAAKLERWDQIVIDQGPAFPVELQGGESISPADWPSIRDLGEALAEWHRLRHEAENAWRRIPAADRARLRPPETA